MTVIGIDLSSRSIDFAILDNDTNHARHLPVNIADKRGAFYAARNVRPALRDARDWEWDDVYLVGLEDSMYRSAQTIRALARVQGAVLDCIPQTVCVVPLTAQDWKRETVGLPNASKDEIREWAIGQIVLSALAGKEYGSAVVLPDWPQDAFDAYCIAYAARALNQRGIEAA